MKSRLLMICLVALVLAPAAIADAVYHSERLELRPLVAAPGGGAIVNIHPNGSQVYAHEIYTLKGTLPDTQYFVRLWLHPFDTDCSDAGVNAASTSVQTNRAGNGRGDLFISPDDVPAALRNQTHGVRWDVTLNGVPRYQTRCTQVTLD